MKILHVIDSGGLYGAEMMLLHLAREQQRGTLIPAIASIGAPDIVEKPLEIKARELNLPVAVFRMKPGPNLMGAKKVLDYCHANRFDIIHSHGYKSNILFGFMPRKFRKTPMVTTLHGWTSTNGMSRMAVYEWLDARSLKMVDAVVLVNQEMLKRAELAKLKSTRKLHVIDNGIPLCASDPDHRFQPDDDIVSFCRNALVIGAIGRCSREKGFDVLIDAFQAVKQRHASAKLLLIGDGPLLRRYRSQTRQSGLEQAVMFAGYRAEAFRYLPYMTMLCMPSRTEGLPITLLEAMRAKTPVVASAVGGIPRVIAHRQSGLLVRSGDPVELAEAICAVIERGQAVEQYVQRAYRTFLSRYSDSAMARRYHRIYRQLCAG